VEPCQPGCHPGKREPSCFETIPFGSAFAMAQPVARARWRRCFALSLALRVLLDLAVFFTWGLPVWVGSGHFLADILNGGHRLGPGKRYRFSGTPSEAARYRAHQPPSPALGSTPRPQPTASPASANNRLYQHAPEAPLQWSISNRCCPRSGHTEPLRRMVGWLINGEAGTMLPDGAPPTVIAVIRAHHPQLPGNPSRSSRSASSWRGHRGSQ
jgi:hypothetical protein